jgi:hypothetical protein
MSFRWLACVVVLVSWILTSYAWAEDKLTVSNGSGEENGFIFWGSRDDWGKFPGNSYNVSNVDQGDWNQIVAFTKGRPPYLSGDVKWSPNDDPIPIDYRNSFEVPVKVWVLCANRSCTGVPDKRKRKLAAFLVWANERLLEERAGFALVRSGDDWIVDETDLADNADDLMDFDSTKCSRFDTATRTIKSGNAINFYMVDRVDRDRRRGRQCSNNHDSAVIGYRTSVGTKLHEIGHILGLGEAERQDDFEEMGGEMNVMCSASNTRWTFTEGQVFRMFFSMDSGFNDSLSSLPGLPPGRLPRDCTSTTELPCPTVGKMVWDDTP